MKDDKKLDSVDKFALLMSVCLLLLSGMICMVAKADKKDKTVIIYQSDQAITTSSSKKTASEKKKTQSKIYVAPTTEAASETTEETTSEPVTEIVTEILYLDLNAASQEELMLLPGIGEVLSGEIISYRESHGGFRNIEEIMEINGIGEGIFNGIRDMIYVVSPVYEEVTEPPAPVQDTFNPEEPPPPPPPPETEHIVTLEEVVPINVNTADRELLMLLPDIGEEEADEIIALRDELEGFRNVYELRLVQSISDEQLSRILEYICV